MNNSASKEDKHHYPLFKRNSSMTSKVKYTTVPKKEGINEHVINNYNLKGNITIKNMNNISIENVMLHPSQAEKQGKISPILFTEPSLDYTKVPFGSPSKLKKINFKNLVKVKDNKDINQRQSDINEKEVNKMITDLQNDFKVIGKKNNNLLTEDIHVLGEGLEMRHGIINAYIDDSQNISNNKAKESISSLNSIVEHINVDSDKNNNDNDQCHNSDFFNDEEDISPLNNANIKRNMRTNFLKIIPPNNNNNNNNNPPPSLIIKQSNKQILKPQTSILSTYGTNLKHQRQRNKHNSIMKSIGLNDTFSNTIININPLNQESDSSFNCINKQITFSIKGNKDTTSFQTLLQNSEKEKKMENDIEVLQNKISDLEVMIKTLNSYIKAQENAFISQCQSLITKNVKKENNKLLSKERELNTFLIKENKGYKKIIITILYSLCLKEHKESKYKAKEQKVISQIIKENEYLRQMNGSINHVLLKSYKPIYNSKTKENHPHKKKSSNKLTNDDINNHTKNSSNKLINVVNNNDTDKLIENQVENSNKTKDALSISSIVNKSLEETIKKLAECKSITEIEKMTGSIIKK